MNTRSGSNNQLAEESLFEGNHDIAARLAAYHSSDVAMACRIVRKHHISRSKTPHRAVSGFNLNLTGKGYNILAPRRIVIVAQVIRWRAAKDDAMRRLKLRNFHCSGEIKLDLNVFEMRFVIGAGEKSSDLHERGSKEITR